MVLTILIALKFHRNVKNDTLVSLISLISIISITIGVITAFVTLSVVNGFNYELNKRLLSIIPHIEIQRKSELFINWIDVLTHIKQLPHIINITPYINFPGIIEYNNQWNTVQIRSVDLTQNLYLDKLLNFIEKSTWQRFCKYEKQVILGKGISDVLNIKIGDWITVLIANNMHVSNNMLSPRKIYLQVSGILNIDSQLDYNFAIIPLLDAQYYCGMSSVVDGIAIQVDNVFSVDQIIQSIRQIVCDDMYDIRSWIDKYGYIYRDIQIVRVIIYLSMVLIMGMSCFNVMTALTLLVNDKCYDILILRTLGVSNFLIQRVFFLYGFIIYIISSIVGSFLGVFISLKLSYWIEIYYRFLGEKKLLNNIYFVNFIPIKIDKWDLIMVLGCTVLLGSFTSWYATVKIKKINFIKLLK